MDFTLTLAIVAITVLVSWRAFNDRALLERLILWPPAVERRGQYDRLLTHGFIHADWMHLLFNMITLWSFGSAVEQVFSAVVPACTDTLTSSCCDSRLSKVLVTPSNVNARYRRLALV